MASGWAATCRLEVPRMRDSTHDDMPQNRLRIILCVGTVVSQNPRRGFGP